MSTPDPKDPNRKTRPNQYAPGDPNQPRNYEFAPDDFVEQGEEQVLTDTPDEVEESFKPESDKDADE